MFVEAAEVYDRNSRAMKLRAMNLAYEGAKDSKGVLLAPSALADGFNVGQVGGGEEDLRSPSSLRISKRCIRQLS